MRRAVKSVELLDDQYRGHALTWLAGFIR
jgi:hypothetical protein